MPQFAAHFLTSLWMASTQVATLHLLLHFFPVLSSVPQNQCWVSCDWRGFFPSVCPGHLPNSTHWRCTRRIDAVSKMVTVGNSVFQLMKITPSCFRRRIRKRINITERNKKVVFFWGRVSCWLLPFFLLLLCPSLRNGSSSCVFRPLLLFLWEFLEFLSNYSQNKSQFTNHKH